MIGRRLVLTSLAGSLFAPALLRAEGSTPIPGYGIARAAEAQQGVIRAVQAVPGIAEVRRARVRVSGPQSFVDLTVGVAPGLRPAVFSGGEAALQP